MPSDPSPDPDVRYAQLVELLRRPYSSVSGGLAKTWTYDLPACCCDYLADEHRPDCPVAAPPSAPYTMERGDA